MLRTETTKKRGDKMSLTAKLKLLLGNNIIKGNGCIYKVHCGAVTHVAQQ